MKFLAPPKILEIFDMSEIAKAHTLTLQSKASQRVEREHASVLACNFPSMLKNTLRALARSVFDR